MVSAVGATQATGFVATVKAAYTGSKLEVFAKGFFALLKAVFSTVWAWKLSIAGVVLLGAAVYYRAAIQEQWNKCCSANGKPPEKPEDKKDEKKA